MQIDYHYYGIYVLCRLGGLKEDISHKIAYSSQHVDDAKYNHLINFKNGGIYQQEMSAHKFYDIDALTETVGYEIFMPFHFLPGNIGSSFQERLVCRANSDMAKDMMKVCLASIDEDYGVYRLGVGLHIYADTWTHDGFNGLNSKYNKVIKLSRYAGLSIDMITRINKVRFLSEIQSFYFNHLNQLVQDVIWEVKKFISPIVPPIGHGQALTCPDEPYLNWQYLTFDDIRIRNNNLEKVLASSQAIYKLINVDLRMLKPEWYDSSGEVWQKVEDLYRNIYSFKGSSSEREENWKLKIKHGYFGFKSVANYKDREWFKKAVSVITNEYGEDEYIKSFDFYQSDWKLFQDALKIHKDYVKSEILPKLNLRKFKNYTIK